ncbi:MAG: ImmA/IrrE family metallo-endopeptidase [Bacteroidota bacterium]|nr:ImmA/IrrE family metallo-endopeptidase [Bacteroidota bacterium]
MNPTYIAAAKKAEKIRIHLSLNSFEPINIFDICKKLEVTVRFFDINMEGMYISQSSGKYPTIILSNKRPMPRRVYNCAHELGHHTFGHGSRMDMLAEHKIGDGSYNHEERLVDTFAGVLLMPIASILAEFRRRGWAMDTATQLNYYIISSFFGVGYQTLISHCRLNALISEPKAASLLRTTPAKLLKSIEGTSVAPAPFKIIDGFSAAKTVDMEVSNYLFLPADTDVEGGHLEFIGESKAGNIFISKKPGIVRVSSAKHDFGTFVRIQNNDYVGLAENRHLEND